jgi:hypothetical protein
MIRQAVTSELDIQNSKDTQQPDNQQDNHNNVDDVLDLFTDGGIGIDQPENKHNHEHANDNR